MSFRCSCQRKTGCGRNSLVRLNWTRWRNRRWRQQRFPDQRPNLQPQPPRGVWRATAQRHLSELLWLRSCKLGKGDYSISSAPFGPVVWGSRDRRCGSKQAVSARCTCPCTARSPGDIVRIFLSNGGLEIAKLPTFFFFSFFFPCYKLDMVCNLLGCVGVQIHFIQLNVGHFA